MSLDSKINTFLKSKEGKQKIADAKAKALKEGRTFGQPGASVSKEDAIKAAKRFKQILLNILHTGSSDWNLESIEDKDIIIGEPEVTKDGKINIDIWFDEKAVFRPSLDPSRFSEGVPNIVVHLTHGWNAAGAVTGTWYSKRGTFEDTTSRMSFNGDDFMQEAVNQFNEEKLGTAELNEKYL